MENDRSILISTSPRRVLPLIRFSSASTSSPLTSASFIRMRRRFPRRCAHGNRGVEQDSSGTRFYPFFLSLSLSHSLLFLFYIGSYMPRNIYRFPIILQSSFHPRRSLLRGRARVLIRGVILHSKFIWLSVPPPPPPPNFETIFRHPLSSPAGDAAAEARPEFAR